MLTLLSITHSANSEGELQSPLLRHSIDGTPSIENETISGTELERAFWAQLRNSKMPDDTDKQVVKPNEMPGSTDSGSMTLLNVRIEKVTDTRLFNLRRRFANILGPNYAVALGSLEGPILVVAFGNEPPSHDQIHYFRQHENMELIHAPLTCLDDFDRITIVNGLNPIIVTATPGRVFTLAGGWHKEFYLKTCEELDFDSILGLRIEPGGTPPL